jgi:hypothetical protein
MLDCVVHLKIDKDKNIIISGSTVVVRTLAASHTEVS